MVDTSRRRFLVFFGASAASTALAPSLNHRLLSSNDPIAAEAGAEADSYLSFTPVRLPHPLSIYQEVDSFEATGVDEGVKREASTDTRLTSYTVIDDVVVPPEYERYVIVEWGDRVFPDPDDYFGYNNDYTAFIPLRSSDRDGFLWVNHEYISYPLSELAPGAPSDLAGLPTSFEPVIGYPLPTVKNRELFGEFLYNVGGSIVRIYRKQRRGRYIAHPDGSPHYRNRQGRYMVHPDFSRNRRIHGLSGLGINRDRTDGFEKVTSWGDRNHQKGDNNYLVGTGPTSRDVFEGVNVDGLGNRIIGTAYNCSGATTPWGTVLSAEENFQATPGFFVSVQEQVLPNGSQTGYVEDTTGAEFGLVGEKYGWMVEIDPADPSSAPRKHTALGRFRHENAALRVQRGRPLIAYMGDDRRGGHTWKFVSKDTTRYRRDKRNSALFEEGTLYAARFYPDGTGEWIALELTTPTNPTRPSDLAEAELTALGVAQRDANTRLPKRNGIAGQTEDGGFLTADVNNEDTVLPDYQGKVLGDFYLNQGALLADAFLAANLAGCTPTGRPEDLEVNPFNNEVIIAYTDNIAGGDGYPDSRIFQVGKLSEAPDAQQPSGGLYKIIEDSRDGSGTTFRWERFILGGEDSAELGDGFANVDNLEFDYEANVWGVTDMSTSRHNGFRTGANPTERTIDHTDVGGTDALVGVFGNNWLFYVPTRGANAGQVIPFAYGPTRCEMTGPTFIRDHTLLLSVQHPGEDVPIDDTQSLNRDIEMLDLNGGLFNQNRTVSLGSVWPSNISEKDGGDNPQVPRPAVIGIRRLDGKRRFV